MVAFAFLCGVLLGFWAAAWYHQYFWWERMAQWMQLFTVPWLRFQQEQVLSLVGAVPLSAVLGVAARKSLRLLN